MGINLSNSKILIAGGGGFIGGWLAKELLNYEPKLLRVVDIKPVDKWFQVFEEAQNLNADMSKQKNCDVLTQGIDYVFNLASDMGGMGFIENNKALCMLSVLINTNLINASKNNGVSKYFFASSACVYRSDLQKNPLNKGLKEEDAYPASPEDGYGWEKLFGERMCRHFNEDFSLDISIVRFHNVYGPYGTYDGGREKAPAAICRKIALAKLKNEKFINVWGDGNQTRSFMYIDDCVKGILDIFKANFSLPINLGSSYSVSINQLIEIVEKIADYKVDKIYDLNAPKGVNGRNSSNELIQKILGWEPNIPLEFGLRKTYDYIYDQLTEKF